MHRIIAGIAILLIIQIYANKLNSISIGGGREREIVNIWNDIVW